jgi:hypothetical protein
MDLKVYLICVLISTFIWLMMKMSDEYSKEIEIPIGYTDYPEGMILVNKPVSSLKVQVESQGFKMMTIALRNNKKVHIDLSKLELQPTRYKRWVASIPSHLFAYDISSQLGVDPIGNKIKPDSIYFVFDTLITRKVPVKVNSRLSFVQGNTLYKGLKIEPPAVDVTGPALAVKNMKYVAADSLVLERLDKSFKKKLALKTENPLIKLNPASVMVSGTVAKFSEFSTSVPLVVETTIPDLKIRTFPAKVTVTYSIPIPERDNISDSSFVVVVEVDSMDVLTKEHLIPRIVRKPDFVKSAYLNVDKVEFIILK